MIFSCTVFRPRYVSFSRRFDIDIVSVIFDVKSQRRDYDDGIGKNDINCSVFGCRDS